MNNETQKALDRNNQMFREIFGFDADLLNPTKKIPVVLPLGDGTCSTQPGDEECGVPA